MPTQKVPAIRTAWSDWRGPALLIGGMLIGVAATAAWLVPSLHRARAAEMAVEKRLAAQPAVQAKPVRAVHGRLTHPLLTCSTTAPDSGALADVRASVTKILDAGLRQGLTRAAVHVSDLETCEWFEIGGSELFHPASMMKLPLALTWLRRASQDGAVLSQQLLFDAPPDADSREDKNVAVALVSGQSYAVEDLLQRMLIHSRNDAKWLLARDVPPSVQDAVWTDLGLLPPAHDRDVLVNVNEIALMLHALYDGAWLGRDGSERALGWLSNGVFTDGLTARLPAGAIVAHKFGRRVRSDALPGMWWLQLHECGILYRTGHPVLVCVMTEGTDERVQQRVIQEIGAALWSYPQHPSQS